MSRILVKGGSAVFLEPLGHNPIVNAWRRLTPAHRTEDERPIRLSDVKQIEQYFNMNTTRYFGLWSIALSSDNLLVPTQKTLDRIAKALVRAELKYLHRIALLKRLSVFVLIRLTK